MKNFVDLLMVNGLLAAFLFLTPTEINAFADQSKKVGQYIEILNSGTLSRQIDAAKEITKSGLSDPVLFDLINTQLLANYLTASGSEQVDYMAWLCKALASSGIEKYKQTLLEIAETTKNSKLERYARQSLENFTEYAEINKIISDKGNAIPDRDPEVTKIINMLRSDMMKLKRDAAKMVTRKDYSEPVIYEIINDELLAGYAAATDKVAVDAMAWLCMALATSTDHLHKETLKKIADNSSNPKLTKYANKALESMN